MREQAPVALDAARDAAWARIPHPVLVVDHAGKLLADHPVLRDLHLLDITGILEHLTAAPDVRSRRRADAVDMADESGVV